MVLRRWFYILSAASLALVGGVAPFFPGILWLLVLLVPLIALGVYDVLQRDHTVLRNFPLIGHGRYFFEMVRPEIQQYFIETNTDGTPFSREARSIVYQRSKGALQTLPFGTQHDVYAPGYEWMNHSLAPVPKLEKEPRLRIGGDGAMPYDASHLNISAMSFGSLSAHAVLALNHGARMGGFAHNTGEGGLTRYHLEPGGDIIWQVGTGYFGCRTDEGRFDGARFREKAMLPQVRMIEVKLSQGAKPGHGGILPARKVTPEIAEIRGVPLGKDVISPAAHTAFDSPRGLLEFVARLRELSGGKPVGFKLCVGAPEEFLGICKAMLETDLRPDFITVDGTEGGTGAAPLEFSNSVGTPLREGLLLVDNALRGIGLRDRIRVLAANKVVTGFQLFRLVALGADGANAARGMMFSLGCIQALRCHSNKCPTGVATQDKDLMAGLDVPEKSRRVARFHHETIESFLELLAAAGLSSPSEITPRHVLHRASLHEVQTFAEAYPRLATGALLERRAPPAYAAAWGRASARSFR